MKPLRLLPFLFFVAACTPIPDNISRVSPQGGTEIQILNGRNCLNNRCVHINMQSRIAAVNGRNSVRIPSDIDLSSGYVSVAEFNAIFAAGMRAVPRGAGTR